MQQVHPFRTAPTAIALTVAVSSLVVGGTVAPARAAERSAEARWSAKVGRNMTQRMRPQTSVSEGVREGAVVIVAAHFDAGGRHVGNTVEHPVNNRLLDAEAARVARVVTYPRLPVSLRGKPRVVPIELWFGNVRGGHRETAVRKASRAVVAKYERLATESAALPKE